MTHPFLAAIKERPLLGDGAMGTLLYARGAAPEASFEQLNLTDKDMIQQAHIDYINAGAEVIETNSYGGNRFRLAPYGLEKDVWQINVWAAKLARNAREIAGQPVFVAGSVGPTGKLLAPIGDITKTELEAAFKEQMEGLLAGGVDLFIIESMASLVELSTAVRVARKISKLPIVAQLSFTTEGHTIFGTTPEDAARMLAEMGEDRPDLLGMNCGAGPGPALESMQRLAAAMSQRGIKPDETPLSCLPNAGLPGKVGANFIYGGRPDYCASFIDPYLAAGARLIGGCCGTGPEHIAAMRAALDTHLKPQGGIRKDSGPIVKFPSQARVELQNMGSGTSEQSPPQTAVSVTAATAPIKIIDGANLPGIAARLKTGCRDNFFVSVELDPPKGAIARKLLLAAEQCKAAGADTINVGDSPMARVRMSSMATCLLIQQQVGIESIIHFTTRDRNLMGIQADLLGCQGLGIKNVIALTGDPPSVGNYAHATAVYDVDSIGLIKIISQLNQGVDVSGNSIGSPTSLTICCALNPTHENRQLEKERCRKKIEAGAHVIMTQPIYQLSDLTDFLTDYQNDHGGVPIPILAGIMPLHSFKHAEYLHNEVPGISIPEHVRKAMEKAGDDGARVGIELAEELLEELRPIIAGVYMVPSFGRNDDICTLVTKIKKGSKQAVSS